MKNSTFFVFFGIWTEIFGLLSKFLLGFVKIAFYVSNGLFWIKTFFEQKICILSYSHKERTVLAFHWNFFGGVVKIVLLMSWRTFLGGGGGSLRKNYKFIHCFETLCEKCWAFWQISSTRLGLNFILRVLNSIFRSFFP